MTRIRSLAAVTAAAALILLNAPAGAQTLCSAPIAPFCIQASSTYDDVGATDRCRQDLESFAAQVDDYEACLAQQIEELRAEQKGLEDDFSCRADGDCSDADALP